MTDASVCSWSSTTRRIRVGAIEVDLRYRRVCRADGEVELTQRCFDLFLLFLAEPGVLHTRDALFQRVWPGVVVEDANLTTTVWMLRKALGAEAKEWVRTVAKQGYVFDPPSLPVDVDLVPLAPVVEEPAPLPASGHEIPRDGVPPRSLSWRLARYAATVLLAVLGVGAAWWQARARIPSVTRIALLVAVDPAMSDNARWPVDVLRAWTAWKLGNTPHARLSLLSRREQASNGDHLVVLGVDMPLQSQGSWRISARLYGPDSVPDIVAECSDADLVATLDKVSHDVHVALMPREADTKWPALALDVATAKRLAEALRAEQRHMPGEAIRLYRDVTTAAPHFGFARVRLAENLLELGQQSAAAAEIGRARDWTGQLPPTAAAAVSAVARLTAQEFDQAATTYEVLAQADTGSAEEYRLAQARSLRRGGRTGEALTLLARSLPESPAAATPWLVERALVQLFSGDPVRARADATTAMELAARLGWPHEEARATLVAAEAAALGRDTAAAAHFDLAVQRFRTAGDELAALRARLYAQLAPGREGGTVTHLEEVLAQARAAGNAAVEIDALRRTAFFHYRSGRMAEYRQYLAQASDVADLAGDVHVRRLIDLDLLHQDVLRGDVEGAEKRMARLNAEPAQGALAYWLGQFSASLALRRGQYETALSTVQQTELQLRRMDVDTLPSMAASLSCLRGGANLSQGNAGAAHLAFGRCRTTQVPHTLPYADIGDAELAVQAGDTAEALRRLRSIPDSIDALDSAPDRWMLMLEYAPLLARAGQLGDARDRVESVVPLAEQAGYQALVADARLTLAEIALAQGRHDDAGADLQKADRLLPPDDWMGRRRLRTAQAVLVQSSGQTQAAAHQLETIDADARHRGDVLGELLVHSLIDTNALARRCPRERHARLIAQSGMRGASDTWLLASESDHVAPRLAEQPRPH
ncbi:winged helix-turn-helix domain-containing protein [Tahibacter amnicola]|uniref:Winged helix-turn-helix domain-containing protein n=1 Tax=Tahibacter amnicola TaxID=2976241 RepID=A0ABY6BDQ3_9GAMM|nr:winged helix-turn-helix domain-containing protein [Tahibacter amnicola]UXI67937.1 winged helix-turn-helix domain-containing protein [Tahibacter amnicola]